MAKYIWIKLSKDWGTFVKGDTFRCGLPKGQQLIEAGYGHEVPEPADEKKKRLMAEGKAKADTKKAEKEKAEEEKKTAEKATKTPDAETADNRPNPKEATKK